MARAAAACGALAALLVAACALAQTFPAIRIEREDAVFDIVNRGTAESGARSLPFLSNCEEGVTQLVYYGPERAVETKIDDGTTLTSSVVIVRRPAADEGDGGSPDEATEDPPPEDAPEGAPATADDETIELLDKAAAFAPRPPCLEGLDDLEAERVELVKGRTTVDGSRFFLDRGVNVADMDGPIALVRSPEGEAEELTATADGLRYDLDTERSTLTGNVRVEAGERVSEAESLELDEEAGVAVLTGNPARSTEGADVIEGDTLLYYLDSNDVVVLGRVRGEIEIELE